MFIHTYTKINTAPDKKWVEKNCVEVFIPFQDRHQHGFSLGSMGIYRFICHLGLGVGQCKQS